ncbi:MAG: efflux RND transporter periplasmic adaptor subunit [Pseudomonadota bacterium]
MPKLNSTATTFVVSIALAAGIVFLVERLQRDSLANGAVGSAAAEVAKPEANAPAPEPSRWAATAPGKVEPRGGEVGLRPEVAGKVAAVHVAIGDTIAAGDILFQLKDDELQARHRSALTEVRIRQRERSEDTPARAARDRLRAADAVYDAERALHDAKTKLDEARLERQAGRGSDTAVTTAQAAVNTATTELATKRKELDDIIAKDGTPLPTRLEGGLETARAELRILEIAIERTRVRAPRDGTVLAVDTRVGELVGPNSPTPVVRFGSTNDLTVTAEVAERDLGRIKIGQSVVVETAAFPDQQFQATVAKIAPSLSAPQIGGRGPRLQSDVDVIEVTIDLQPGVRLLPGMRVDVYFRPTDAAANTAAK